MNINIDAFLHYQLPQATDLLLQIEAADLPDQIIRDAHIALSPTEHFARVFADEGIGERIWLRMHNDFTCRYTARIEIDRPTLQLEPLVAVPPHRLPGDVVKYLMPSRYCQAAEFQNFVIDEFGDLQGGQRIAAMRNWIANKFEYLPGASDTRTTALESFVQRRGVCRDYAHVMIALARASAIPARFASVYAPNVSPPDFHAVAEIYLEGTWHLVDTTGMATASDMARIGVGVDAASVAFLTNYSPIYLIEQSVTVSVDPVGTPTQRNK